MGRVLVLMLLLCPGVALAQDDDAMEVQRCVWRCLADSPGAESAEYQQCVAARCNDPVATPAPQPVAPPVVPAGPPWGSGATQDGQGFFAGQYAAETDNFLYYTCDASGTQNLLLTGQVEGPAAVISVDIDGQVLGLWFDVSAGGYTSRLDPGSPLPGLIALARRVELRNGAGWSLGQFGMAGAQEAISAARAACGL
ncbi:hypothetical protein [Rhodobacter sp. SY28-1]|uniref:hypothetical protein n=1 Tax=Rhodobacter sp. SY28-1 TaxID=2562317 RepID=UPI0010C021E3|nr:hypothetical protein [Rhodobacter sp. SY28-1]